MRRPYTAVVIPKDQAQRDWLLPDEKRGGGLPVVVPGAKARRAPGGAPGVTISCPDHAVALLDAVLRAKRFDFHWRKGGGNTPAPEDFEVYGREQVAALQASGLVKSDEALAAQDLTLRAHQYRALGLAIWAGDWMLWHACGAGKTVVSMLAAAWWAAARGDSLPGVIVLVTRVPALLKMRAEFSKWSAIHACIWWPKSDRNKAYKTPAEEVELWAFSGKPIAVIVGQESVPTALPELLALSPSVVIFDEVHKLRSWRRWTPERDADGEIETFTPKLTAGVLREQEEEVKLAAEEGRAPKLSGSVSDAVRAYAMMKLSRKALHRVGLTASPIPTHRRDIWAQLDLVYPGEMGAFYKWCMRFCAGHPGSFGGIETEGESNTEELEGRLSFIVDIVNEADFVTDMPPVRYEKVVVAKREQSGLVSGGATELKNWLKSAGDENTASLMMYASAVRDAVLDDVEQVLLAGQKTVIFTGLQRDAEWYGLHLRQLVSKYKRLQHGGETPAWCGWCHGGQPASVQARHALCQDFVQHQGPAVLAATGFSIGEAIDLPGVHVLQFAMIPPTPEYLIQWRGRSAGFRQTGALLIKFWAAEGTRAESVVEVLLPRLADVQRLAKDATSGEMLNALRNSGKNEDELLDALLSGFAPGMKEWRIR